MTKPSPITPDGERWSRRPIATIRSSLVGLLPIALVVVMTAGVVLLAGPVAAQDDNSTDTTQAVETTDTGAADAGAADAGAADAEAIDPATLSLGADVYSQICSACHQPGGTGLPGSYPPLLNNPNVADTAYVKGVVNNGRQGEIVVDGETYNGVMPSFSTLAEDEVDAVIVYIQSGFQAPAAEAAAAPTGPVAGTELPGFANFGSLLAFLLTALVILMVLWPRLASRNDRLQTPWLDAWLKAAVITLALVLAMAYLPNWVLQSSAVAAMPRMAQDFIGVSVWGLGLAGVIALLYRAHQQGRV